MGEWTFRDYQRPSSDGDESVLLNDILSWTLGLPKKAQAKIDAVIITLQSYPVWPAQYVSGIGRPGILELRCGCSGVQYRPLGCYGPAHREFTVLIGTIEKGGRIPTGDLDSAELRRHAVLFQGWPTCEHEFAQSNS